MQQCAVTVWSNESHYLHSSLAGSIVVPVMSKWISMKSFALACIRHKSIRHWCNLPSKQWLIPLANKDIIIHLICLQSNEESVSLFTILIFSIKNFAISTDKLISYCKSYYLAPPRLQSSLCQIITHVTNSQNYLAPKYFKLW